MKAVYIETVESTSPVLGFMENLSLEEEYTISLTFSGMDVFVCIFK